MAILFRAEVNKEIQTSVTPSAYHPKIFNYAHQINCCINHKHAITLVLFPIANYAAINIYKKISSLLFGPF